MKSVVRTSRITPKKLNLVAGMIRRKDANEALELLKFTPKKAAIILRKALKSAISNAENNFKQEAASLYVKEVIVTKASTLKRWLPASRGRSQPILKRNAHVTVLIGVKEGDVKKKGSTKKDPSKTTPQKATAKKTPAKTVIAQETTASEKPVKSKES